jgi:hypothetical protein
MKKFMKPHFSPLMAGLPVAIILAMKSVNLDNPVYGALWSVALDSDRDENDILRRLLGMSGAGSKPASAGLGAGRSSGAFTADGGYRDPRYGVHFPEGFTIFRTYQGKPFTARVFSGKWVLADRPDRYDSLNALNTAIGARTENAWYSWNYQDTQGRRRKIGDLRNPEEVQKRQKNKSGPDEQEPLV